MSAALIAQTKPGYEELAVLGDQSLLTVWLNDDFTPLKKYMQTRAKTLGDQGMAGAQDRYSVGVGAAALTLYQEGRKGKASILTPDVERLAYRAIAVGVIANMPEYDSLARDTGIERDTD
jgi:hypothetical protein